MPDMIDRELSRVATALAEISPEMHEVALTRESTGHRHRWKAVWVVTAAFLVTTGIGLGAWWVTVDGSEDSPRDAAVSFEVEDLPESVIGSGDGWALSVSQANGVICYQVTPLLDEATCSPPESWSVPYVLTWGATWGNSDTAQLYGVTAPDVARIEFEFLHGAKATVGVLRPASATGAGGFYYEHNVDRDGIFIVISSYRSNGELLGTYDARDECAQFIGPIPDERVAEMCSETAG